VWWAQPSKLSLVPKLKKPLRRKSFRCIEEVSNEVTWVIRHINNEGIQTGIQHIIVLKLSPCCRWGRYSSGYSPGVWILKADVSEPSVGSIFTGRWLWITTYLWRWNRWSVPKCWLLRFRHRGNTQKNIYLNILSCFSHSCNYRHGVT
jgi:hypothetical protein